MFDSHSHFAMSNSLRNVEDLLHERGIDVCHESVRLWVDWFGTYFAHKIRKRRSEAMRRSPQWQWHLDEVFVKIRGECHYLWRAVDHEGEGLEAYVTKKRDKAAALKFLKKSNETIWKSQSRGNGQMSILPGRDEGDWE